ncbi:MAG: PTS transporter subunit EIIC [Mycoplasma sp.]|nr:PTS transporter subunit EIIC [Mycoplasma sp.]
MAEAKKAKSKNSLKLSWPSWLPKWKSLGVMNQLSRVGKSLLFPIAMLPVAAILLRVGVAVPPASAFAKFISQIFQAGGNAIFKTLPILFAIGVGFGLSKDSRGEAAISAFVTMALLMILMSAKGPFGGIDIVELFYGKLDFGLKELDPQDSTIILHSKGFHSVFTTSYDAVLAGNVLNGILVGAFVAFLYNKFNGIELPSVLGFFSGRRLIPVLSVLGGLIIGLLYAAIFPWLGYVIFEFSNGLASATGDRYANAAIMGVYGVINRLLIPFGLHHIPNTLFWFQLPLTNAATGNPLMDMSGNEIQGDIFGFLSGVAKGNTSGTFQSGFFPIMMFGLPALSASFYFNAEGDVQKKRVAALLMGSSIVSFFTGITEPIEFSFMFVAPALFGMHAVLTGIFGFITGLFGIQIGFGFSAGLIDYVLSVPKSIELANANHSGLARVMANPAWIWVIGAATAATYFSLSTFLIRKFEIGAPGRGKNQLEEIRSNAGKTDEQIEKDFLADAQKILEGLGGKSNITHLEWCATRLRVTLKDVKSVDEKTIKSTQALGVMKMGDKGFQVVIGPKVELMGEAIKTLL